jgi:uncharacterized membrane protein (UPF0127 family)
MASAQFLRALVHEPDAPHRLVNSTRGIVIATSVEAALDSRTRKKGLLGRTGLDPSSALVIAPTNAVHTFGMQFPIDILFVRRNGQVVKRVISLRRRRIAAALWGYAVVELAANHPGVAGTQVGDELRIE